MEFEDMKKIWDTQNDRPLFAIDENTLLKRVLKKKNKAAKWARLNEWGLILINLAVIAAIFFGFRESVSTFYAISIPLVLALGIVYIVYIRFQRKKGEEQYDRTLLGELDHAIANVNYLERMARTMAWWYILPLGVPLLVNMIFFEVAEKMLLKFVIVTGGLTLAYFLTKWEARRIHRPKRKELENLREMLISSH